MKKLIGICIVLLMFSSAAYATNSIPLPRERPTAIMMAQGQTNPDPFNTKHLDVPGQTQMAQAGTPANQPIVLNTTPQNAGSSILNWINSGIMALFAAIFGKLAFKLPQMPTTSTPMDAGKVNDVVTAVLHPQGSSILNDPALRANVDAALLKIVQSGLPGTAIQSGLSLIPGAGPIVSGLEPILRNIVIQELQKKAGATATDPATPATGAVNPLEATIAALIAKGFADHAAKPAT